MAWYRFFLFIVIISFDVQVAMCYTNSTVFLSSNLSKTWRNNGDYLPQTTHFLDGSTARFILVSDPPEHNPLYHYACFGFGFFCDAASSYLCYLSIAVIEMSDWSIRGTHPQVVWSANRNNPVGENATLKFSQDGDMRLTDEKGAVVWTTNTFGMSVMGVSMNSSGNLVLFNETDGTLWQSFDHPTDTLLVGQMIWEGQRLISRASSTDVSRGLFFLTISGFQLFGVVELDTPTRYIYFPQNDLVSTLINMSGYSLRYIKFGEVNLAFGYQMTDHIVEIPFQTPYLAVLQLLRLDFDGGLRIYGWAQEGGWNRVFVFLDGWDECQFPLKCGRYGLCVDGQCTCPSGVDGVDYFTPVDRQRPSHGCHQITPLSLQSSSGQYQLVDFGNLCYFSYSDPVAAVPGIKDQEVCNQVCLLTSSCEAAFFKYETNASEGYCYLPTEILSIRGNPILQKQYNSSSHIKVRIAFHPHSALPTFLLIASMIVVIFSSLLYLVLSWKNGMCKGKQYFQQLSEMPKRFSYGELCVATNKFSEKLGGGGFGAVFKGQLRDITMIAVKRLDNIGQGMKEFLAEVETIGSIHHINLVRLIGFCVEKSHRLLVYEYMSNGSLDKWIFGMNNHPPLDWNTRKRIILDIAKGLAYLHEDCRQRIAHLDVKPQNILLDDNFNAKLSDFGLSKLIDRDQSQVITSIRGTLGYLAPEWRRSRITVKADIYSFGVVLLEVVSGRRNLDYSRPESDVHLLSLLQKKAEEKRLIDIVDNQSQDMQYHGEEGVRMIRIGMCCLNGDHTKRPLMSTVVKVLEGVMELEPTISFKVSHALSPETNPGFFYSLEVEASVLSAPS